MPAIIVVIQPVIVRNAFHYCSSVTPSVIHSLGIVENPALRFSKHSDPDLCNSHFAYISQGSVIAKFSAGL
jgi:hypothetical protein